MNDHKSIFFCVSRPKRLRQNRVDVDLLPGNLVVIGSLSNILGEVDVLDGVQADDVGKLENRTRTDVVVLVSVENHTRSPRVPRAEEPVELVIIHRGDADGRHVMTLRQTNERVAERVAARVAVRVAARVADGQQMNTHVSC